MNLEIFTEYPLNSFVFGNHVFCLSQHVNTNHEHPVTTINDKRITKYTDQEILEFLLIEYTYEKKRMLYLLDMSYFIIILFINLSEYWERLFCLNIKT